MEKTFGYLNILGHKMQIRRFVFINTDICVINFTSKWLQIMMSSSDYSSNQHVFFSLYKHYEELYHHVNHMLPHHGGIINSNIRRDWKLHRIFTTTEVSSFQFLTDTELIIYNQTVFKVTNIPLLITRLIHWIASNILAADSLSSWGPVRDGNYVLLNHLLLELCWLSHGAPQSGPCRQECCEDSCSSTFLCRLSRHKARNVKISSLLKNQWACLERPHNKLCSPGRGLCV